MQIIKYVVITHRVLFECFTIMIGNDAHHVVKTEFTDAYTLLIIDPYSTFFYDGRK